MSSNENIIVTPQERRLLSIEQRLVLIDAEMLAIKRLLDALERMVIEDLHVERPKEPNRFDL